MKTHAVHRWFKYLPITGIIIFVGLFITSAWLYPGGSNLNQHAEGFDWMNNYWCNLTDKYAINGLLNPARSYAQVAVIILCFCLASFFYQFPLFFKLQTPWNVIVPIAGIMASIFTLFIHSSYHDSMAIFASVFGGFSVIGIFFGLRKYQLVKYIWSGSICLFLVALNGAVYFSGVYIEFLPLIQKITIAVVLLWFALLNSLFRLQRNDGNKPSLFNL
jgi:hypothetical protein